MNNIHSLMQELGLTLDARTAAISAESLDAVMANTVRQY